LSADYNQKV
jgi:chromosome segregation ATPase